MDELDWYKKYEDSLAMVIPNLEATADLFDRLMHERNFALVVIKQLMIDSGKYDITFSVEDLKSTDGIKLLLTLDEDEYKYSLIFPDQEVP